MYGFWVILVAYNLKKNLLYYFSISLCFALIWLSQKNKAEKLPVSTHVHRSKVRRRLLNKSCSLEKIFLFLKKKVGSLKKLLFLFSQKDTYLAFQFLSPSVLLSCYHHLKAKNGTYFCPSIFEHFRMVCSKSPIKKWDVLLIGSCACLYSLSQYKRILVCLA